MPVPEAVTIHWGMERANFLGTVHMFFWNWAGVREGLVPEGAEPMLTARTAGVHHREAGVIQEKKRA